MAAYLAYPSVPLCAMLKIRACDHQVREDEARRRPNAEPRGKHVVIPCHYFSCSFLKSRYSRTVHSRSCCLSGI